jgi:histidinol-phosphate aminotransferase
MYRNLAVLRSFSFAYGLAAARLGYALMPAHVVTQIEAKLTPHRVGQLTAELAIASLLDADHLDFVSAVTTAQRERLHDGMRARGELEPFPSLTNFILCRVRAPWTGRKVHDALLARGIKVKIFESIGESRYDEYFRVTVGLEHENTRFLAELPAIFR